MKTVYKLAVLTIAMLAVTAYGFSQDAPAVAKPLNLERGVTGPISSSTSWAGFSALAIIPGAGVIPVTNTQTVLYLGFTAGTTADVSNMVLYSTARNSTTITAVTPVTLGGVSHPSIKLSNTTVCPVQPLSSGSPCIVRLDPIALSLSALNDYYLVVFFTANDSNNSALGGTLGANGISSLAGWFLQSDQTKLTVGSAIPAGNSGGPTYFLMYVMTN